MRRRRRRRNPIGDREKLAYALLLGAGAYLWWKSTRGQPMPAVIGSTGIPIVDLTH